MAHHQPISEYYPLRSNRNVFAPFPRLPPEVRIMIWEFAVHGDGCLVVINWQEYGKVLRCLPQTSGFCQGTSPLTLVNHEARAVVTSLTREFIYVQVSDQSRFQYGPSTSTSRCIGRNTDMFYVPTAPGLPALLKGITKISFAHQLRSLAVNIFGHDGRDDRFVAGQEFEDAIQGLPKLRELYFVVDKLFSIKFGPGHVPKSRMKFARRLYKSCPDHVANRTALREHIRDQEDGGYGFSDYETFKQRWQWPIASQNGKSISFKVYDAYCHQVVARARQIADKLQRHISVKLMVDLDGLIHGDNPYYSVYERSDMNFENLLVREWYDTITTKSADDA